MSNLPGKPASTVNGETRLTPAQKRQLRGQAQLLNPLVTVGKNGLTQRVLIEFEAALLRHHLVKVRFNAERNTIKTYCRTMAAHTGATHLGSVGKTAVFYR